MIARSSLRSCWTRARSCSSGGPGATRSCSARKRASEAGSRLALGAGYTVAGLGPLLMGLLIDLTGGYPAAIGVLLAAAELPGWSIIRISASDRPRSEFAPRAGEGRRGKV
jgi:hypothetical protein